jgi:two-component system, cell cycle sensor histidine kinase and response regulator CckA
MKQRSRSRKPRKISQFRAIFEGAPDAMLLADDHARYVDGNPAALALLEVSLDELRKLRVQDLAKIPPDVTFEDVWRSFLNAGRSEGEVMLVRGGGRPLVAEFRAKANIVPGLHLSVLRDVSPLRRLAEVEERMQRSEQLATLGMLAASLVHEIRNPVSAVLSSLELMQAALSDRGANVPLREFQPYLAHALEAVHQLTAIVRDVHLLTPKPSQDSTTEDVHRVLDSTLRMASAQLKAHTIGVNLDYGSVPAVRGSASRISQVLLNIVINAAQALESSGKSKKELHISTRFDAANGKVLIEVKDNGPGISPDVMAQLFVPFFTTKPSSVGTGLGLAIARSIVLDLGGDITVASELGQGTTLSISLCAQDAKATPPGPAI